MVDKLGIGIVDFKLMDEGGMYVFFMNIIRNIKNGC